MGLVLLQGKRIIQFANMSVAYIYMNVMSFPLATHLSSTRVSNELGAGNPQGAQTSVHIAMLAAITVSAIVSLTLFALRSFWGRAYSDVDEVISYVTEMAPLVCVSIILDNLQGVLSGILA